MDFAVTDAEWSAIIETNFQAACVFFGPLFAADGNGGLGAYIFISSESATNVPVEIILKEAYRRFCVIL